MEIIQKLTEFCNVSILGANYVQWIFDFFAEEMIKIPIGFLNDEEFIRKMAVTVG